MSAIFTNAYTYKEENITGSKFPNKRIFVCFFNKLELIRYLKPLEMVPENVTALT